MIYLYTGENSFALAEKINLVSRSFKNKYSDTSLERIDGGDITATELQARLTSVDMFTPRKLLVITGAAHEKTIWDALAKSLPLVPNSTEVVIVEPKLDARLNSTKEIKRLATITEFKPLKPYELDQWVKKTSQRLGLELKGDAHKLIIDSCGGNQWEISHELEDLSHVTRAVTDGVVHKYIQPSPETNAFQILELAVDRDLSGLNLAIDILSQKEDINKFLGLITSQVFALAAIKNQPDATNNAARDMGLAPFMLVKQQGLANKLTADQLNSLISNIAKIDGRVKLGDDGWALIRVTLNQLFS